MFLLFFFIDIIVIFGLYIFMIKIIFKILLGFNGFFYMINNLKNVEIEVIVIDD